MSLIQTQDLTIGYTTNGKPKVILENLNLKSTRGRLICLIGRNGSGKSTLLRTLGGLQSALGGNIFLDQKELGELSNKQRAKMLSMVLTHNTISGMISVREVVALGRYPYTNWLATLSEEDNQVIDKALQLTDLTEVQNSYYDQLSDGQQQKVIIARAISQNTSMIILDEPTNHLDIGNKAEILQLLSNLAHSGLKSILVSTHDLDLALQMADELWVLADNELISGPPEKLLVEGVLDRAFPYTGIDLFSGKLMRPAKGPTARVDGSGREADITRSALRRLGFRIKEEGEVEIRITVSENLGWNLSFADESVKTNTIEEVLEWLAKFRVAGSES